jgi:hypothetical protein
MLNPIHRGIKIANLKHFSRKDNQSIRENIAKFTNQYDDGVVNPLIKLSLFGLSLVKTTFCWFFTLPPSSINN